MHSMRKRHNSSNVILSSKQKKTHMLHLISPFVLNKKTNKAHFFCTLLLSSLTVFSVFFLHRLHTVKAHTNEAVDFLFFFFRFISRYVFFFLLLCTLVFVLLLLPLLSLQLFLTMFAFDTDSGILLL